MLVSFSFSDTALTEVSLPSTLTEAAYPFNGSGITKASFAENTKTIPSFLFYNYYKLTYVSLPETLTQINNYAFNNCSSLSTIELNEGLEKIGSNAFTATAITEITLPSTIKTGGYAFAKSKLEKASFAKGAVSVPTQPIEPETHLGDYNNDGSINAVDASYVLSYYAYCSTNAKISLEEYLAQNL